MKLRSELDLGLGDTISFWLHKIGISPETWDSYKIIGGGATARLVKTPEDERCHCEKRREWLNKKFPYRQDKSTES